MVKSLHTNYSKKQNSKSSQYVFKIYNQFSVFGYFYNFQITGSWEMHTKFNQKA